MVKYIKIEDAAKAFSIQTPYCYKDCLDDLMRGVLNGVIELEDAAPVIYAKWVKRSFVSSDVFCSECRTLETTKDSNYKSRYCPHCGAKMDLADD